MLKAKYSFIAALVFFIVANPETYRFTERIFGSFFVIANGSCPTPAGVILHTVVFFAVMWGLMMIPNL